MYVAMVSLGHITSGLIVLAAIQFPAYGLLIGLSTVRKKRFRLGMAVLFVHLSAASICIYHYPGNF